MTPGENRLARESPDLWRAVAGLSSERRQLLAVSLTEDLLQQIDDEGLRERLNRWDTEAVDWSLVHELDEAAWTEQETGDERAYVARFAVARTVNAIALLAGEPSVVEFAEAIYEARHVSGQQSDRIVAILGGSTLP